MLNLRRQLASGQTAGIFSTLTTVLFQKPCEMPRNLWQRPTVTKGVSNDALGKKENSRNRSSLFQCSFKKFDFCGTRGHPLTCGPAVSPLFWSPDLRAYTKAFGYRIASIFPNLSDGVRGLRFDKDCHSSGCCCLCFETVTIQYTYICINIFYMCLTYSMIGIDNPLLNSTHDNSSSFLCCVFVQAKCKQEQPRQAQQATEILSSMMAEPFDDWLDADMESVIQYLRSNKKLRVADDLRRILRMNS